MVGSNLKAEAMKLMDKRTEIEAEMNNIIHRLTQPGGPGLSGNLVDSQGFPRTDIDISSVRGDRGRLDELRNDHKNITEKINQHIELLHSARISPKPSFVRGSGHVENSLDAKSVSSSVGPSVAGGTASAMDVDVVVSRPFALVDEINEASPAAEDGLQLGDQVVKFGSVEFGENLLQKLAAEAQGNQDRELSVVVIRQGVRVNITMTPRAWGGRGLLGCHFRML
ncbi:hypothetical protein Leryth_018861 [Lithospermum erythrorhizon]|nr:hypothetical protein Leryth_018861 [Lithospermum erythrorhizon]